MATPKNSVSSHHTFSFGFPPFPTQRQNIPCSPGEDTTDCLLSEIDMISPLTKKKERKLQSNKKHQQHDREGGAIESSPTKERKRERVAVVSSSVTQFDHPPTHPRNHTHIRRRVFEVRNERYAFDVFLDLAWRGQEHFASPLSPPFSQSEHTTLSSLNLFFFLVSVKNSCKGFEDVQRK